MLIIGMVFNKVWGIKQSNFIELKNKMSNLQERMNNAQMMGDMRQIKQLQLEANQLLKSLMTKQFLPMCARCILFLGFWLILDIFVFFNYRSGLLPFPIPLLGDGWVALYFLFSIGFGLLIYGCKKLYKKLTGKEEKKPSIFKQLMNDLSVNTASPLSGGSSLSLGFTPDDNSIQNHDQGIIDDDNDSSDTWKDKIQK
jgi:hypothetical protein